MVYSSPMFIAIYYTSTCMWESDWMKSRFRFLSVTVYRGPHTWTYLSEVRMNITQLCTNFLLLSIVVVVVVVVVGSETCCCFLRRNSPPELLQVSHETLELWCVLGLADSGDRLLCRSEYNCVERESIIPSLSSIGHKLISFVECCGCIPGTHLRPACRQSLRTV